MKNKERILRAVFSFVFVCLILFACRKNVSADMGAKPSINLKVLNAPEGEYYIAVLGQYGDASQGKSELKIDGEVNEENSMEYLEGFSYDGWSFKRNPLNGTFSSSNDEAEYYFYYYSVPNPFRVVVITSNGDVYLSPSYSQKGFDADCTYDFATGEITEEYENKGFNKIVTIIICLIITLIVEMLVFLLFRFPFKKGNIICFLLVNIITNLTLNIIIVLHTPLVIYLPLFEVFILVLESIIYFIFLRDKEDKRTPVKSIFYGISANIVSAVIDFVVWVFVLLVHYIY